MWVRVCTPSLFMHTQNKYFTIDHQVKIYHPDTINPEEEGRVARE